MARWFRRKPETEERDIYPLGLNQWASYFGYAGNSYPLLGLNQTLTGTTEPIPPTFAGYTNGGYKGNAVVFACMATRLRVFSEARFVFRRIVDGRPGDLFAVGDGRNPSGHELDVLMNPWPGGTTGDLLARGVTHADLAGNFFGLRRRDRIRVLRPDWVDIILTEDAIDADAEAAGYVYYPGGRHSGHDPEIYDRSEVAHFAPYPDPIAHYRGMSPLTPLVREVQADTGMTEHRQKFLDNGATPNMVVKLSDSIGREAFKDWIRTFEDRHEGLENAYKTLYLGGGADATVVGANFRQLDFKQVQGGGETRIAAAFGVPPVIVGLSEGLQAATYSNYGQARRHFADASMRPLWRNMAGSMAQVVRVPSGSELWYDDRDVAFLREDEKDAADIEQVHAITIRQLIEAGFMADAVVDAVMAQDMSRLKGKHTGLFSVQLQAPGAPKMPAGEVPGMKPEAGNGQPQKAPAGLVKKPFGGSQG